MDRDDDPAVAQQARGRLLGPDVGGYCWPWSEPRPDDRLVNDVHIGDWARPWNVKGDRSVGSAPPSALWATKEGGFDQVGCIYTAQGFEYDWYRWHDADQNGEGFWS